MRTTQALWHRVAVVAVAVAAPGLFPCVAFAEDAVPTSTITNVTATAHAADDDVTIAATMLVDGQPFWGGELTLSAKPQGAPDTAYIPLVFTTSTGEDGVGQFDDVYYVTGDYVDVSKHLQGPVTFKVEHPADDSARASFATVDVTPRPISVSLTGPDVVTFDKTKRLSFEVRQSLVENPDVTTSGTPILQSRPAGTPDTWTTAADFDYYAQEGFTVVELRKPISANREFRVVVISDGPGAAGGVSNVLTTLLRKVVTAKSSPSLVPPGSLSSVSATVTPARAGDRATLEHLVDEAWVPFGTKTVGSSGKVSWQLKPDHLSTETYRVVVADGPQALGNTTTPVTVTVAPHAGGSTADHSFLARSRATGKPLRWNPCKPINVWFNDDAAPRRGVADAKEALRRVSQITGLRFIDRGRTNEMPRIELPQRHQAIIAWARLGETNYFDSNSLGWGGAQESPRHTKNPQYVRGFALLNAEKHLPSGFGAGETWGEVLLHEIGHMVGLNHAQSRSQIMFSKIHNMPAAIYGAGDYNGLKLLGRSQGCLP